MFQFVELIRAPLLALQGTAEGLASLIPGTLFVRSSTSYGEAEVAHAEVFRSTDCCHAVHDT